MPGCGDARRRLHSLETLMLSAINTKLHAALLVAVTAIGTFL